MWAHRPGKGQDLRGRDGFGVVHQPAGLGGPQSAGLQLGDFYTGNGLDRLRAVFVLHRCTIGGSLQTDKDRKISHFVIYKILQVSFYSFKDTIKMTFFEISIFKKLFLKMFTWYHTCISKKKSISTFYLCCKERWRKCLFLCWHWDGRKREFVRHQVVHKAEKWLIKQSS